MEIKQLLPPIDADGNTQPLTAEHVRLLFNQQLEHYIQETEVYKSENQLLKDQLMLERNGRVAAQVRIESRIHHYNQTFGTRYNCTVEPRPTTASLIRRKYFGPVVVASTDFTVIQ